MATACLISIFFFNDTATTEIYTRSRRQRQMCIRDSAHTAPQGGTTMPTLHEDFFASELGCIRQSDDQIGRLAVFLTIERPGDVAAPRSLYTLGLGMQGWKCRGEAPR